MDPDLYKDGHVVFRGIPLRYSSLGGKTDKLDEAVNRELNVTRS